MPYKNREQKQKFQREWLANRRKDFFKDKSCLSCGSVDKLELDHVDRTQKISHRVWSWSFVRRTEELEKCQVLCNTCHWEKTRIDLNYGRNK